MRRTIPWPSVTPAKPAAMPVAKGLTVEPNTPAPAPQKNNSHGGDGVIACGEHDGEKQGVKSDGFLCHAKSGSTQSKGAHQDRDEQLFSTFQPADDTGNSGINGAGFPHYSGENLLRNE